MPHIRPVSAMAHSSASKRLRHAEILVAVAMFALLLGLFLSSLIDARVLLHVAAIFVVLTTIYYSSLSIFFGSINLVAILAAQTVLWYTLPFSYLWLFDYTQYIQVPFSSAVYYLAFLTAVVLVLFSAALIAPQKISFEMPVNKSSAGNILGFLLPILMLEFLVMGSGYWGYRVAEQGYDLANVPEYVMLSKGLAPATAPMCALLLGNQVRTRSARGSQLLLLSGTLAFQLVWLFPEGRRTIAIVLFVSLLAYLCGRHQGELTPRCKRQFAIYSILGLVVVSVVWQLFFLLRQVSYIAAQEGGAGGVVSFSDLSRATELDSSVTDAAFLENIITRPFILWSFVVAGDHGRNCLYGLNLLTAVLNSVPGAIFAAKSAVLAALGGVQEELWASVGGIPYDDHANTIALEGYVDIGWLGVGVYF